MNLLRCDATCRDCGVREKAKYSNAFYRCSSCTEAFVSKMRRMADDGMTQKEMKKALGMSGSSLCIALAKAKISTVAGRQQLMGAGHTHGCTGPAPKRLMPSQRAVAHSSIFALGGAA